MLAAVAPVVPRIHRPVPKLDRLKIGEEIEAGEDERCVDDDGSRGSESVENWVDDCLSNDTAEVEAADPNIDAKVFIQFLQQAH